MIETCSWISAFCFSVCGIPQAYMSYRQKHSNGVSWLFLITWIVGEITGIVYGLSLQSASLLVNYVISFICAMIIVYWKFNKGQK